MEWIFPIIIVAVITGMFFLFTRKIHVDSVLYDTLGVVAIIFLLILFGSMIVSPTAYYSNKNDSLKAEAYWESIQNCVVEKHDDYVVVDSLHAGVWQSGGYNINSYNQYIKTNKYWDSKPIAQWFIYPVPDKLRYIRISGGVL
jgi:hypothetical protein